MSGRAVTIGLWLVASVLAVVTPEFNGLDLAAVLLGIFIVIMILLEKEYQK